MPPSFTGSRSGTSTRRPAACRPAEADSSSRRFWNTPPERTTRSVPWRDAARPPAPTGGWGEGGAGDPGGGARATGGGERGARPPGMVARLSDGDRIAPALVRVAGGLELDRRLALVRHLGAQPAQRGGGVEQPAHAGGR